MAKHTICSWINQLFLWPFSQTFFCLPEGHQWIFEAFPYAFPIIFRQVLHGFPWVFPMVFHGVSHHFQTSFTWFSMGFPTHHFQTSFTWLSMVFPMVFHGFSHDKCHMKVLHLCTASPEPPHQSPPAPSGYCS